MSNEATFLAAETCNLRIWQADRAAAPIASCKVSEDVNFACSWAPAHSIGGQNLIATGGVDRALTIVDTRLMGIQTSLEDSGNKSPVAWFKHKAHPYGAIRCLAWNPFVPYWIATGGEDRVVNVWDLRYDVGPVARVDQHYQSVESVSRAQTLYFSSFRLHGPIATVNCSLLVPQIETGDCGISIRKLFYQWIHPILLMVICQLMETAIFLDQARMVNQRIASDKLVRPPIPRYPARSLECLELIKLPLVVEMCLRVLLLVWVHLQWPATCTLQSPPPVNCPCIT